MVRDAAPSSPLGFLIKVIEPDLSVDQLAEEVRYLYEDLRALSGLHQTRFRFCQKPQADGAVRDGILFEADGDRLHSILKRLCDRLDHHPLETLVLIYQGALRLQIQTRRSEELAGIVAVAEAMLPAQRIFLGKALRYSRSQGELSPAEVANLELLRQHLGLTAEVAAQLQALAQGPYQTLAEKRQYFQQVLVMEMTRACPLSEQTWETLEELADNLGLPSLVAREIYQDQLQQVQIAASALHQQKVADQARQEQLLIQERNQQHQHQVDQRQHLDHYRAMVRQALATTLYPATFDQGRLEQARQLWKINPELALEIEADIKCELYGPIASEAGVDYSRLRQLLWQKDWRGADQETENAIFQALSPDRQPLEAETISQFPCVDLCTIDQLWHLYSQGRFGFTVQQKVYAHAQNRPADFLRAVEWASQSVGRPLGHRPYKSLSFSLSAPLGHLPTWRWCCVSLESGYSLSEVLIRVVMKRLNQCLASEPKRTLSPEDKKPNAN
ncbi:MAG: GUN4 domain-containing protein [Cyanobacteria bacterium REEB459]|nr:GUN4 domain-containing protein [Cyanobacteria bacterium REEB459]